MKEVKTEKATYHIAELYAEFTARRIYYITDVKGEVGGHAHRDEDEIFVMVKGSCKRISHNGDEFEREEFKEGEYHVSPRMDWHGFESFSKGAILFAMSSTYYDPTKKGYINDINQLIAEKND